MTTNQDMVSVSALERLFDRFGWSSKEDKPEPEPQKQPEPQETFEAEYQQAQAEIEQYKAQVAEYQQAQARQERIAHFATEFNEVEALEKDQELHELLADIDEEQAALLVTKFKAITEQARVANLTEDVGKAGGDVQGDPETVFDAAVRKVADEKGINYAKAMNIVREEQPELFKAYYGGK